MVLDLLVLIVVTAVSSVTLLGMVDDLLAMVVSEERGTQDGATHQSGDAQTDHPGSPGVGRSQVRVTGTTSSRIGTVDVAEDIDGHDNHGDQDDEDGQGKDSADDDRIHGTIP